MIICQTPLRVSFFGGGTDLPEFFLEHGGAVLATAIDKYIYHSVSHFPSRLFDYSIRLAYRKVECVNELAEIEHVPFREILRHFGIDRDVEISLAADLPSFSGLGSSSSFTVGTINALSAHQGRFMPKNELASLAIYVDLERQPPVSKDAFQRLYGRSVRFGQTANRIGLETFVITSWSASHSHAGVTPSRFIWFLKWVSISVAERGAPCSVR
jgi:galactokinase/mevalonate kinase-like predicted kinase